MTNSPDIIMVTAWNVNSPLMLDFPADYVKGFGGKFGVQSDRQDKSALGWDHQEKLQLHESQKGTETHPSPSCACLEN